MRVLVAEKPSVARDIAKVIGASQKKDGYLEGNNYRVTWCYGHLVAYSTPDRYGEIYQKWSFATLPIIPEKFKTEVPENALKQFMVIQNLINHPEVDEVICATDAGREGELIFRLVYQQANCSKPFKRLWISSMTDEAIGQGLQNLKNGRDYDRLYQSARCRAEADWLIGLNATRLFTVKYNLKLTVGRVQTPTLAMIVNRHLEIVNFKPEPFYQLRGNFEGFAALWQDKKGNNKLKDKAAAESIQSKCQGKTGIITALETKEKSMDRPQLYDLTELQRDANRRFGYTAQQVLDTAQSLYETHKLITYPRTDSRCLTKDLAPSLSPLLSGIKQSNLFGFGTQAELLKTKGLNLDKRVVDDSKVTDHHAILPTNRIQAADLNKLNLKEQQILKLIAARLIVTLSEKHVYDETTVMLEVEGERFKASGKKVKNPGWKGVEDVLLGRAVEKDAAVDDVDAEQIFPQLEKGQAVLLQTIDLLIKKTQPKKPFTEATLLSAMEHASEGVEESELKESLKERGLGTPATRAAIIEKLIQVEYIERSGKKVQPTPKGIKCIELMPEKLKQPALTGEWEYRLNRINQGNELPEQFIDDIKNYVQELVNEQAGSREGWAFRQSNKESLGKCPKCGKNIYEGEKSYYCEGYKAGCKFGVFKTNGFLNYFGVKAVAPALVKSLLESADLQSTVKLGTKNFGVALVERESGYYNLEFDKANAVPESLGACPECGKAVIEMKKGFSCSGYKETGCKFALWKEDRRLIQYGKTISLKMAGDLLAKRVVKVKSLVNPQDQSKFDAQLELVKNTNGYWDLKIKREGQLS